MGIRRSLRGEAADIVTNLGEQATIEDILDSFRVTYGDTESSGTILRRFHSCTQ